MDKGRVGPKPDPGKIYNLFSFPVLQEKRPGLFYRNLTKVDGGELKVETKEGEGAEFIILLPL